MKQLFMVILMTILVVYFDGLKAQKFDMLETTTTEILDDFNDDYIDNEIDMKRTYISGIEKFLQSLMHTIMLQQQSGFAAKFISQLPKSVREFFANQDNDIITSRINGFGDALNAFKEDFHTVFPGTLWCGGGNVAKKKAEVGLFSQVDKCCMHHDQCPYSIQPGETMEQLLNNGMFTRSACSCDFEFYKCLKNVSTLISVNIGTTYFNILRPQCFGYHYPIKKCIKHDTIRLHDKKCFKYKLDSSRNKSMEWYDLPDF